MKKHLIIAFFISISYTFLGQEGWTWSILPSMPEAVSNNAVAQAYCGDTLCVYSFTGIDQTKLYSGIHLKAWRYNTISEEWMVLPDVPDIQGKIAAGASTVGNKIYIIGGYHVNANNTEVSSNKIHVFDPETNTWLEDGATIPVPIDDHVQAVWNDSLIFIITGWSNNGNVNNVQIYAPTTNQWSEGTDVPSGSFKVFGGAGTITGDSIFYYGGVTSGTFSTVKKLRKGLINPDNPTEITWFNLGNSPGAKGYRCGAIHYQDRIFFVGGAGDGYNYDGISYTNNQGVSPLTRILTWWSSQEIWDQGLDAPHGVMDLRGLARVGENQWVICGGMESDQEVSDAVYLLTLDTGYGVGIENNNISVPIVVYFSEKELCINGDARIKMEKVKITDTTGKLVYENKLRSQHNKLKVPKISNAVYIITIFDNENNILQTTRIIQP